MAENTSTIMVVDDEEYARALLQRILKESDYDVITAASGQDALDKLSDASINLVLLDIRMPGLDGFQTLELIRKQSNIPVLMVTGASGVNYAAKAIDLGADDYIKKPFSSGELLARIQAKLRRTK